MSELDHYRLIVRVLRLAREYEVEDAVCWHTNGKEVVTPYAVSESLFHWGGADCVDITPENAGLLERTLGELSGLDAYIYGVDLFMCRVEKMRPQGCCYPMEGYRHLWPLFDACGPEREVGLGNPYRPGEREERRKSHGETAAKHEDELRHLAIYDLEERL